ncbi:inositol monophosphatase family protein [Candidatus Pantoea edessiphila]|uniref:Inositol-1-monophosphatase n=1 Tax=Candidatus Pantoea edessiphila TaxID=2044610 RepID=A0A2P5SWF7_9GAMM|nr:inositol monophosphatase family protein [Candidatus Pantoea edessiphila]PPI86675.1 inositol monophosphatase [Candidatus Pantoea edessiphila]
MHPMLNIAIRAVRKAGNIIIKNYEIIRSIKINEINNLNVIQAIKLKVESSIIEVIHKAYPQHTIYTEIGNHIIINNQDILWIVEPLDCMHNFIKGLPNFSISITLIIKDRIEVSVVYAPILNELFSAVRGQGAQLNGYRLRCNNTVNLKGILLSVSCLFGKRDIFKKYINKIIKIFDHENIDFRRTGSIGLDMAYVAAGRLDGYFHIGLRPWNFSASELLIRESGGLITDFNGKEYCINSENIIAANPYILKSLLLVLNKNN